MSTTLKRSNKITYDVIEGAEVLQTGAEIARNLFNFVRWCAVSYNWKLRRARGHFPADDYRHLFPKYPGRFTMDKAMRKDEEFGGQLADRCFSYVLKDFDIAMKSWFSNVRNRPSMRPPRYAKEPRILTFEVGRNAKAIGPWTYRLTVLGSKYDGKKHAIVRLKIRPGVKMREVKLIRLRIDGTGVVNLNVEVQEYENEAVHYAAIDLGINNIATVAFTNGDTIIYNGRMILSSDRYYHKRAAKTKPSGWHRGKAMERSSKRNRSYRRKAGDIRRLATHNLTRSIIDEAVKRQVGTIFVGDLKNIRDGKDYGKRMNQRLHAWQFGEIERQLKYKGEAYGIEVVKVSEAYTSQTCSVCGVRRKSNRVHRGLYRCSACGTEQNADVNGARNILRRGIEEKVSPGVQALGVEAVFPGLRSPAVEAPRIREVKKDVGDGVTQPSAAGGRGTQQCENANATDYAAKFDLRNLSVTLNAYNVRTVAVGGIC